MRLQQVAVALPGYEVRHDLRSDADPPVVHLETDLASGSQPARVGATLFPHSKKHDRVSIELHSDAWSGIYASYEEYTRFGRLIMAPAISAYNKRFGSRRRIHIPTQARLEPNLSPVLRISFDRFTALANRSQLHPLDWERFYSFVRAAHELNVQTRSEDLSRLLQQSGFDPDMAQRLGEIYEHGRAILQSKWRRARRLTRGCS